MKRAVLRLLATKPSGYTSAGNGWRAVRLPHASLYPPALARRGAGISELGGAHMPGWFVGRPGQFSLCGHRIEATTKSRRRRWPALRVPELEGHLFIPRARPCLGLTPQIKRCTLNRHRAWTLFAKPGRESFINLTFSPPASPDLLYIRMRRRSVECRVFNN